MDVSDPRLRVSCCNVEKLAREESGENLDMSSGALNADGPDGPAATGRVAGLVFRMGGIEVGKMVRLLMFNGAIGT